MKLIEIIVTVIIAIGLFFKSHLWPGGSILVVFPTVILCFYYFLFSFALLNGVKFLKMFKKESYVKTDELQIILSIFLGLALSFLLMVGLYSVQKWEMQSTNQYISIILTLMAFLLSSIVYFKKDKPFFKRILIRTFLVGVLYLAFSII
jgi:hypothetical protein